MALKLDDLGLTENQKTEIRKLEKSTIRRSFWFAFKNFLFLVAATGLTMFFNLKYVNSQTFVLATSFINGFMFYILLKLDFSKETRRINKELTKILSDNWSNEEIL